MTPAEFKKRFKVGDVIRNKIEKHIAPFLTITFIGKSSFVCIDDYDIERLFIQSHDWEKVEQEKKPSEEIREISEGKSIKFIGTCAQVDKQSNFQYIHNRMDAIEEWIDENWPKVAKK